jgi:hypothetical protein
MAANLDVGLLIDAIVGLVALEAACLVAARTVLGRGPSRLTSIANCAAGGSLLLAVRAAIGEAPFPVIALCLFASLVAHVADLASRWRDPRSLQASSSSAALVSERSRV